jgi:hypothetical protein
VRESCFSVVNDDTLLLDSTLFSNKMLLDRVLGTSSVESSDKMSSSLPVLSCNMLAALPTHFQLLERLEAEARLGVSHKEVPVLLELLVVARLLALIVSRAVGRAVGSTVRLSSEAVQSELVEANGLAPATMLLALWPRDEL